MLCVSEWYTQRFAFYDDYFVSHAEKVAFMERQCYIGPKEEILKNMNLPDQQFIYALDFWNGAHLEIGESLP